MKKRGFHQPSQRRHRTLLVVLASGLISIVPAFAGADTTPPELKFLAFAPQAIDTSTSAVEVSLGFTVTDDASGATFIEAAFVDPSGVFRQSVSGKFAPTRSGTYAVRVTFPQFSAPGTWTLSRVFFSDVAGNTLNLDTDGLSRRGFPTRLEVRSVQDTVSPKLTALEFAPLRIDTSLEAADVKVNYQATDDLSGVQYIELNFVSPSGVARRGGSVKFESTRAVSNSMTVSFPRMSEPGQWTLSAVYLADAAGNTQILDTKGLAAMNVPTALEVVSTVDATPPSLTALHFAPDSIDTSQGPATVEVGFAATDDLSGVKSLELVFLSPSGIQKQNGSAQYSPAHGMPNSLTVTFPRRSEPGQWTLGSALLADAAGNTLVLDSDALSAMGVRTVLDVVSKLDTAPPNLTGLRFTPSIIDTNQGSATVEVGFAATDNLSGVKSFEVVFVSPSETAKQGGSVAFSPRTEIADSVKVIFPQSSERGAWTIGSVVVTDEAGNTLVLDADALRSRLGTLEVR